MMNMRCFLSGALILGFAGTIQAQKPVENPLAWPEVKTEAKPWTRWWWLGSEVDKPNLTYNLEELSNAGIGGVEITPLYGVKGNDAKDITFLSPQWMDMLQHTISESKRLGMMVDMNTGTGWPFGGPQISAKEAATKVYFQKYELSSGQKLSGKIQISDPKQRKVATLSCLMAYSDGGDKINLTDKITADSLLDWVAPAGNWKLVAVFNGKTLQAVKRAAPGGTGLVMDHFSKEALDTYLARFSKAFTESGVEKPHTFFNDSYEVYGADWTPSFFQEFYKRRDYHLEDFLPDFLGNGNANLTARLKSDYRQTVSEILLENFTKPWTDWAHSMGATTRNQAHGSPANIIDLYATVDIPECETFGSTPFDIPGLRRDAEDIRQGDADPMMLKFSSSAAHIAGKKWVSSESFTWLGEHFKVSFSQCKPELDQLFLAGVNHVFFHGTAYSPKDAVWPGWQFYASVEMAPTNTIWRDMKSFADYIARCQSMLQSGQPDNDMLVYWPIYDMWSDSAGMDIPVKIHSIQEWLHPTEFYKTITYLRQNGYDFDYISDKYLQSAETQEGMMKVPGGKYKTLVIPACKYIPVETLEKVIALAKSGVKVVFVSSLPKDVPGMSFQREKLPVLLEEIGMSPSDKVVKKTVEKGEYVLGPISSELFAGCGKKEPMTKNGLQYLRRKQDNGYLYFVANQHAKPVLQWIKLSVKAQSVAIFDPVTGKSGLASIKYAGDSTSVYVQLQPGQSIFLKTWNEEKVAGSAWNSYEPAGNPTTIGSDWSLSLNGQPAITQAITMKVPAYWNTLDVANAKNFAGTGTYKATFDMPKDKADEWQLDLGNLRESARIKINGKQAGVVWCIPFKINVGSYLQKGKNTIEIEVTNLAANRIAELDRQKVEWRIFKEINFVNVNYKPFDASNWKVMDSGISGAITLTPLKVIK
jgi:hypothetical protein